VLKADIQIRASAKVKRLNVGTAQSSFNLPAAKAEAFPELKGSFDNYLAQDRARWPSRSQRNGVQRISPDLVIRCVEWRIVRRCFPLQLNAKFRKAAASIRLPLVRSGVVVYV